MIQAGGYLLIFAFVFAESGLFFGFFLPGDTLLFTAGFIASQGHLDIFILCLGIWFFAVLGDNVGYAFGKKVGPRIFNREESFWFRKSHLEKAQVYYQEHGKKTIILARFVPIVRTFAPIVAGAANMEYKTFFSFNVIGGFLWGVLLPLLGYFLGSVIPDIDKYILPIVGIILILSILPVVVEFVKSRKV